MTRARLCLVVWALAVSLFACTPNAKTNFHGRVIESWDEPLVLEGTNWDGQPFTLDQVKGQIAVVFFGYTYCPDVCPMTLFKLKQVSQSLGQSLGQDADQLAVVFASVDPHRDTVEKLSRYVPNFDPRFFGVRMDADQIESTMKAFKGTVRYTTPKDGAGTDSFYYVDHTGTYFVLNRQGEIVLTYPPNTTVEELAPDLEHLLNSAS